MTRIILYAGLAWFVAVADVWAADAWAQAKTVVVVMVDNRFEPDQLTFQAGQPYELRLENRGKDLHEFTAPAFLKAAKIKDKRLLANRGTDVVVQSGRTVRIQLIAPPKGHYDLSCADHDWDGMTGGISVN
jgi:plastocyanin